MTISAVLVLVLVATGLLACDEQLFSPPPVSACIEVGVQCELAKGPLGVCERAVCGDNQLAPCFECTPQH